MNATIQSVEIKELVVHHDDRGTFSEIVRKSETIFQDNFAQLSSSIVFQGVAKAWHLHREQTEWITTLEGDMKLVLYDTRSDSPTHKALMEILMGALLGLKLVKIPPGVAHGYRVINGPMIVLYLSNREYDRDDDLRIPHDSPDIGYDWVSGQVIR